MNVVAVQHDIVWENPEATHARVKRLLQANPPASDSLIILPEMFASGFSMNTAATSDTTGRSLSFLRELAREYQSHLLAGLVNTDDRTKPCSFNESILIGPGGGELLRYRKIHPFTLGGEADHYGAGQDILTAPLKGFTLCPFICYDLRFPEIFRLATLRGANLFIVIANWPTPRIHHWTALLIARAIENQAYVVGVNRAGRDPTLEYPGKSIIIDPAGAVIAEARDGEQLLTAVLDVKQVEQVRTKLPFLKDLRPRFFPSA